MKVKNEGGSVGTGQVECVAKVHEEGVAVPAETVLDERVGEFCAMEEICGRDADGMCRPCRNI